MSDDCYEIMYHWSLLNSFSENSEQVVNIGGRYETQLELLFQLCHVHL